MNKELDALFKVVSLVKAPSGGYNIEFEVTEQLKEWFMKRHGASFFDEDYFRKWFHSLFQGFMSCSTEEEERAVVKKFVGLLDFNRQEGGTPRHGR